MDKSKYDDIIEDVKRIYADMVAMTVRGGCKEGFSDLAAAVLTQTVIDAEREERRHRERLYKNVR
jgi:hypothetical protein